MVNRKDTALPDGLVIVKCCTLPVRRNEALVHAELVGNQMMVTPELVAIFKRMAQTSDPEKW